MAKEGSVAPKERVQITYKPAVGDAQQEVELPLRILMMGDYAGRPDSTPLEERAPVEVSKDNFDRVLAAQDVRLELDVDDELSGEPGAQRRVHLALRAMSDFTPDAIAEQVPELRQLLALRKALVALKSPLAERAQLRKKIAEILADDGLRARLLRELGIAGADE